MKISIQSLKPGVSVYKEKIKPDFIERNFGEFYPDEFQIDVLLDKIDRDFRVKISMQTMAHYMCDRCLNNFTVPFSAETEQMYEIGDRPDSSGEDIIYIAPDETELDLKELLNEAVVLNHPIKMLCREDCKGLCSKCGADLNVEQCKCQEAERPL